MMKHTGKQEQQEAPPAKEAYSKPTYAILGEVAELTAGGIGSSAEGGNTNAPGNKSSNKHP